MMQKWLQKILLVFICWFIWKAKNKFRFDEERIRSQEIIKRIWEKLKAIGVAHALSFFDNTEDRHYSNYFGLSLVSSPQCNYLQIIWKCPQPGYHKINTDGASKTKSNAGRSSGGGIIRND